MSNETPELKIAVAIPTYLRERVLIETIEQVLQLSPAADEILVVDQTPEHEPETQKALMDYDNSGKIRWIKHRPPNLPGARNRALKETNSDIIIFIDDDVLLPRDFVARHLKNYENPEIAAVAGRVLLPNSGPTPKRRRPKSWPRFMDAALFGYSSSSRVENIANFMGGNHSVRVVAIEAVGGYDEEAYNVGSSLREESDAAVRLWKAGYRIDFDPLAELIHLSAPTGGVRTAKRRPLWQDPYTSIYFAFCHWYPTSWFWEYVFIRMFRGFVFSKRNLKSPWRLPRATLSYWYAVFLAYRKWMSRRNASLRNNNGGVV